VFAIFAAVITYVLVAKVPLASCGCAGSRQTPPSLIHLSIDITLAATAAVAALVHADGFIDTWARLGLLGLPAALALATAIVLLFAVMGPLTELIRACARIRNAGLVYRPPPRLEVTP